MKAALVVSALALIGATVGFLAAGMVAAPALADASSMAGLWIE